MATEDSLIRGHIVHPRHKKNTAGTRTLKKMLKRLGRDHDDPSLDLSMQYSRGLNNPTGENNCFLNSAVQVLWHLDVFRRNFKLVDGHACMGDACIFCALKVLFTQFQYSDKESESLPPDALRRALAISFTKEKRFQLRSMDDAAECFENILLQIHFCLTNNVEDTECAAGHCIPHNMFAMTILSQSRCECGATSEPFLYKEIVRYITSVSLCAEVKNLENWRHSASFGEVLQNAAAEKKECPSECGKTAEVRCDLMNAPDVVTIGIIWDCDPSPEHIADVIKVIKGSVKIKDMYSNVLEVDSDGGVYELVGLIAYYGKHYCTFFHHSHMKQWLYLEDSKVKTLGPSWHRVADICIKSHYQPSLLFYSNPKWTQIDASNAPQETILLPGYNRTCKSPEADNKTAAAADYWPRRQIAECDSERGASSENRIAGGSEGGVVEIGQAAMGLVKTPDGLLSAAAREDNQNNNRQCPPPSSADHSQTKGTSAPNGGRGFHKSSSNSREILQGGQPLGKIAPNRGEGIRKSTSNSSQTLQASQALGMKSSEMDGGSTSRNGPADIRGGFDPEGWEILLNQQKQEASEKRRREAITSKLDVKPLEPFRPPGAKSLGSLLAGDGDENGFEVHLNEAFIDSSKDLEALAASEPPEEHGESCAVGKARSGGGSSRLTNLSVPGGRSQTEDDIDLLDLSPDGSWVDLSPVMSATSEPGLLSDEHRSVGSSGRTQSNRADRLRSGGELSTVLLSSNSDHGYRGHHPGHEGALGKPNSLSDKMESVKLAGTTHLDRAPRMRSGDRASPVRLSSNNEHGYQGYHPSYERVPPHGAKEQMTPTEEPGLARVTRTEEASKPLSGGGKPTPVNNSQGYHGYHVGGKGAPFWFAPEHFGTEVTEQGSRPPSSTEDWHIMNNSDRIDSADNSNRSNSADEVNRNQQGMPPSRQEHGRGGVHGLLEGVGGNPPPGKRDKTNRREGQLTRNDRSWTGLDNTQRVLWEEAKHCMEESMVAEKSGDPAAALGEITQAAAKLKSLLSKLPREGEQHRNIEQVYRKVNGKRHQLERQLSEEDERSARTYSSTLAYKDEPPQENRFLQDAVDSTRSGILQYEYARNYVPVTHWKATTHTVRHVPIVIEGSHGNTSSDHQGNSHGCISPTREIPVKVYSTLPRQQGRSRPFFVTNGNMR